MKQVAGQLRLDLAQYRSLAAFAQFGSDLDEETKKALKRGEVMTELLKQPQYEPVPLSEQVAVLFAGTKGYLDSLSKEEIFEWEIRFRKHLKTKEAKLLEELAKGGKIEGKTEEKLIKTIQNWLQEEFKL